MFTLTAIMEYVIVSLACALLFALCSFTLLGALQQAGYGGKRYLAWLFRKGNMARSRFTLLAFLIALSSLVLGLCFSFAGKWAAYIALVPVLLFCVVWCAAERHALKVPLSPTARAKRVYVLHIFVLFVAAFLIVLAANAIAYCSKNELVGHLRYILIALLPLCEPMLLLAANALEKPFSSHKNKKYLAAAREKLHGTKCVKIGITGSCGKTSVKNFLAVILSEKYKVLATPESYNTPLGIAKAIENADLNAYDFFIAEMGARRAGDISELCELVRPDHCIVTGICPQHLETFGTIENVIAAKGEILKGTKAGGFAVIGMDENTAKLDPKGAGLVKVGVGEHGECGAIEVKCTAHGTDFKLALGIFQTDAHTKLLGAHSAQNIALAAAMAFKLGLTKEEIVRGIAKIDYIPHRLQPFEANGVTVLDDAYNSNVRGAAAAVQTLRLFEGRKFVITPGLVELGVLEESENMALGERLVGLDCIILVGATLVTAVKKGYLAAGGDPEKLTIVPTLDKAQELLETQLQAGDTVLFLNDLPDIYN